MPDPEVVTGSTVGVDHDSATLRGTVDPNGAATSYWFERWRANGRQLLVDYLTGLDGLALLYAPATDTDPLTDLSGNGRDGTLANGAALSDSGLVDGGAAVVLDGTNDHVDTGWETRTNHCSNPVAGAGGTNNWGIINTPPVFEAVEFAGEAIPNLVLPDGTEIPTGFHMTTDSSQDGRGLVLSVVTGETYRFSVYVYAVSNSSVKLLITNQAFNQKGVSAEYLGTGEWVRLEATVTTDATETFRFIVLQDNPGATEVYFTAALVEKSATLNPYFHGKLGPVAVFTRKLTTPEIADIHALAGRFYHPASKDGDAGLGTEPVAVQETVEGLLPETVYRYRLLAENGA